MAGLRTAELWNTYHRRLLQYFLRRVPADRAEDLLQELFVRIHTHLETLKDTERVESWIFQSARNLTIDYYRSRRRELSLPEALSEPDADPVFEEKAKLASCLPDMIDALPEPYRLSLKQFTLERIRQQDIAAEQELSLSGVKSRIMRGKQLLKGSLQKCCRIECNDRGEFVAYEKLQSDDSCCTP